MAGWMDREGQRVDAEIGDGAGEPWYALERRLIELASQMEADEERMKGRVLVPVQFKPHWRSVPFEFTDFMQGEGDPDWWNASIKQYWAGGVSKDKSYDALQAAIDEEENRSGD